MKNFRIKSREDSGHLKLKTGVKFTSLDDFNSAQ